MTHRLGACLFVAILVACSHAEPPPTAPRPTTFVFDQEQGLQSEAPTFDADVEVPTGANEWDLALRCRADGKPCWRAIVVLSIAVDPAHAAELTVGWRDQPEPHVSGRDSCEETSAPATTGRACTLLVSNEWFDRAEDARRLGRQTPSPVVDKAGRTRLVARVDNAGKPVRAHLTLRVFQWLE